MSLNFNFEEKLVEVFEMATQPVGVDVIAGLLQVHCKKQLKDLHVLDAGCGTGKYPQQMINMGVGKFTLLDASLQMCTVAKKNLRAAIENNIVEKVIQIKLPDLPFPDGTFDAVMLNFVLNHLETTDDLDDFSIIETMLHNTRRVLRQQGVVVIVTMLPEVFKTSYWYSKLHEGISNMYSKLFPSLSQYLALFGKCGFECVAAMNFLRKSKSIGIVRYLDPEGPLKKEWRNGTLHYPLASDAEIQELEKTVLDLKEQNALEHFMVSNDHTSEFGAETLLVCVSK